MSDPGYSIDIDELVVEGSPADVGDLTGEVEVELRRRLASPTAEAPTRSETNAQRIARMIHAHLGEAQPR